MFNKNKKYLIADIGGTNTRLAIVDNTFQYLKRGHLRTSEIKDINIAIKDFCGAEKIDAACIAAAGPLNSDRTNISLTNNKWMIDSQNISKVINAKVILLNDFEALGLSIDLASTGDYSELTARSIDLKGSLVVIGAGTGLGTSILYEYNNKHFPIPSEACHSDIFFDPESKVEMDFYKYLKKKKIIIESESILSGKGLINIYEFLLTKKIKHNNKIMKEIKKSNDKAPLITKYALQDRDNLCIKTVELFISYLSRFSRNLVLNTMCTTLIFAPGIALKILPMLKESFIENFSQHQSIEARKLLENVSVIVLTNPDQGLIGCYRALKT